nr:hypothetical protein L204_04130 [Cryptococcus depauperatus CBS 7855]
MLTPLAAEPRAKRTHARRSCGICKLRKSRCELPDLDVPSGPDPLPKDKACHRCKVLALPCVVDDSNRKQRKRKDGSESAQVGSRQFKRRDSKDATVQTLSTEPGVTSQSTVYKVDHTLNTVSDFTLVQRPLLPANPVDNYEELKRELNARGIDGDAGKTKSIKLHGRPLELTCAMLRVAYGRKEKKGKRLRLEDDEIEIDSLVDDTMRSRLEPGVAQLRTYHPHLDDLSTMFDELHRNEEPTIALLIATVAYLASAVLPPDQSIRNFRNTLNPYIYQRRDMLLLRHPHTFFALQFLELFITHCPFGILPLHPTNLQNLSVAKGLTAAAKNISKQLQFDKLIGQLLAGPGIRHNFLCGDLWLWLALIGAEAAAMLEESNPRKPARLTEARRVVEIFFTSTDKGISLWQESLGTEMMAVLIGKLALCDKIARLEEVLDGMARIRGVLEHSASDPSVDPVAGVLTEFEEYTRRTEQLDKRHDMMMVMLREYSKNVETGWAAYRAIRRRYEFSKIHVTGLRALIATHYLPGSPYAYPDLPPTVTPAHAVAYAITRACNPSDIVRFISDTSHAGGATSAVQAVWEWGRRRGVNMERNLTACAELAHTMCNDMHGPVYSCIVPLHEAICISVESAKILMEMEAGTIHILRSSNQLYKAFRSRSWLNAMKGVAQKLHSISLLFQDDGLGGETVANGASNLIGSMVRTAEEWTRSLQEETARQEANATGDMTLDATQLLSQQRQNYTASNSTPTPYAQGVVTSHQQYMDTSDRWMAGSDHQSSTRSQSHPTPPTDNTSSLPSGTPLSYVQAPSHQSQGHPHQYPQSQREQHTQQPLDILLSEMFGYSAGPSQSQRALQTHA